MYPELQELDTEVIAVSVDTPFVHKVWNDYELSKAVEGGIPYYMGTDIGGKLGEMYGTYDEEAGVDIRGRYIIDPDGVLQALEILTPPVGRDVDETVRQLEALQMVRATEAKEVAPAGWEPGDKTLKPGTDLVGNVWKEMK